MDPISDIYPFEIPALSDVDLLKAMRDVPDPAQSSDGELTKIAQSVLKQEWNISEDHDPQDLSHGAYGIDMDRFKEPNCATGITPSMQVWPGEFLFGLRIKEPKKSKDPQFSQLLNKLFINVHQSIEIFFTVAQHAMHDFYLRAVMVFTDDEDFRLPVKVCPSHSMNEQGRPRSGISEHLLRCSSEDGHFYGSDPSSGRHYVVVKLPNRQAGSEEVSIGFKFFDLGSCPGGVNRRETAVIFTLEFNGEVFGRLFLPLRICTSPRRDLKMEEDHFNRQQSLKGLPILSSVPTKRKFWVLANTEENYNALCSLGEVLEKKDGGSVRNWKQEVKSFNVMADLKRLKPSSDAP